MWAATAVLLYGLIAWSIAGSRPEGWQWFAHVGQLVDDANFWSIAGGYLGQPLWHPSSATMLWQQRVLYPALAALLTFGQASALSVTLVLVNVGAAGVLTGTVAAILRRSRLMTWPSLGFALSAGGLVVLLSDVADLVLVAAVALAWWQWQQGRIATAASLLALSVLAKETAWLFVLPIVGSEIKRGRRSQAAILAGGPIAGYLVAFAVNQARFGGLIPYAAVQQTVTLPFLGLWPFNETMSVRWAAYAWIVFVLPMLGLAGWAITRRPLGASGLAVLANTFLLVCLAPNSWSSPIHFSRLVLPVWLAAALWLADHGTWAGIIGLALLGPMSLLGYGLILSST